MRSFLKKLKYKVVSSAAEQIRRLRYPEKYKTLGFLCDYLGPDVKLNAKAQAARNAVVYQICTRDSWYVPKGSICYILHDKEAEAAMKKGCIALIAYRDLEGFPCIISDKPVEVYAKLCRYYRDLQKRVSITGVTGSIGKSTVKSMIGLVLKTQFNTAFTKLNVNTKTSVGFSVQHIPPRAEKMVQEVHEGEPDETQYISEMLHPDIFVITTIDNSHIEFFGSVERLTEEICSVTKYMVPDGKVIVNIDEFDRFDLLNGRTAVTTSVGNPDADFYAGNVQVCEEGLSFDVTVKQTGEHYNVLLHTIFARHNVACALYAFAAGYCNGVTPQNIVKGLGQYRTEGTRQNIVKTAGGVIVYADCFNAVARSMKAAIDACDSIPVSGKRIAVLGDVEEVGDLSETMHRDIVGYVDASRFDILMTSGSKLKRAIESSPVRESLSLACFDSLEDLAKRIKETALPGDMVLFKASHSGRLDKCIVSVWPELEDDLVSDRETSFNAWKTKSLFY